MTRKKKVKINKFKMGRAIAGLIIIIIAIILLVQGCNGNAEEPAGPAGEPAGPVSGQEDPVDVPEPPAEPDPEPEVPADPPEAPPEEPPADEPLVDLPETSDGPVQLTDEEISDMDILILVNKTYTLASDYEPADLAPIKYYAEDRSPAARFMRQEAADHFHEMIEAAAADGYTIVMTTAYRSYGFQSTLWNNYVARDGEEAASKYSARPGTSEHQTGLAADVSAASVNFALTQDFGATEEGKWLAENAHKYGFILRYTKEGEEITGYMYEPWHFRYVGEDVAKEIHELGCTLEEYLLK